MTEAVGVFNKSNNKRVDLSSQTLFKSASQSCMLKKSSSPEASLSNVASKSETRKKQTTQSLESALQGKSLCRDQIEKKEMLGREVSISNLGGEKMCLSRYLHENGFSYESQATLVSIKNVGKNMINYLVSLFFKQSENPLFKNSLDKDVLERISHKWGVLKDIIKEADVKITPEQVVLNLIKKQGLPCESLKIFLNLFESKATMFKPKSGDAKKYPNYEDLNYPLSRSQFMSDVIEIAKGGCLCLREFIQTFIKPSSEKSSEWERMQSCLWKNLFDVAKKQDCLKGAVVRADGFDWTIVSDGGERRELVLVNQENPEVKKVIHIDSENEACVISTGDMRIGSSEEGVFYVKDPAISEGLLLNHFVRCVKAVGGFKNKQAFVECLTKDDIFFNGKQETLFDFLMSDVGGGFNSVDALLMIAKCIGLDGGAKNKQMFIECLIKPEVNIDGKEMTLYHFLTSKQGAGLSANRAIQVIAKCVSTKGGCKNKQAFIECLSLRDTDLDGHKVTFYEYLISEKGGGMSLLGALQMIVRCVSTAGGSKNKEALIECFCEKEIDLFGKKVSLYDFFQSYQGGGLSLFDTIDVIVKCMGIDGGSKNKQALVACLFKKEIDLDREKVSLYEYLMSDQAGCLNSSEAIHVISKCISQHGGFQNKQALMSCFCKLQIDLDGRRVSLHTFLNSESGGGLGAFEAIQIIAKCISQNGGSKNIQAFIDCFCELEIDLYGKRVSLYQFFMSEHAGNLSSSEAVHIIAKCIGQIGGCKNKQALLECLSKPQFDLGKKKVSLHGFLMSEQGGGLRAYHSIQAIVKCFSCGGGSQNKQVLIDSLFKLEVQLDTEKVSLYQFLCSDQGGGLMPSEAIQIIAKCIGQIGGGKNKQALIDCFCQPTIDLNGKMVPLLTFLSLEKKGREHVSDAIQIVLRCVSHHGGARNKQAFMECLTKPELDLDGKKVTLYRFLCSNQGVGMNSVNAILIIEKCISHSGGAKNKQALVACLRKKEIELNGEMVSLFEFLCSQNGGNLSSSEAIDLIVKCISQKGRSKNKQALIDCFNVASELVNGCNLSLFATFLSGNMTRKEAISLCFIFSLNRYVLDTKVVLGLFNSKKEGDIERSVCSVFNSLNISCYTTILDLVVKILTLPNTSKESKKKIFTTTCQALVVMFVGVNGFFVRKIREMPVGYAPILLEKCITACHLYTGKDISSELNAREALVVDWIRQFEAGYQLTKESLEVITTVHNLDELNSLIVLCNREISRRAVGGVDAGYCESCLSASLQILINCKQSTIKAILLYESMVLNWFDLKRLSDFFTGRLSDIKIDQSIHYFFEHIKTLDFLTPRINLESSFLIYMGLSAITHVSLLPLKLERIHHFFKCVGNKGLGEKLVTKNQEDLYTLYTLYCSLSIHEKNNYFHEIVEGIPKMFQSYTQFKNRYQAKIKEKDWPLLRGLMHKWDIEKEDITQYELLLLIKINYQLPKDIFIPWSNLSNLENCVNGCCVLNQTGYPNWVFALDFIQKIRPRLSSEDWGVDPKGSIVFRECTDSVKAYFSFPLFKIQLHKDGVMFKGESISRLRCFYTQAKLDDYIYSFQATSSKKKQVLEGRRKRSRDQDSCQVSPKCPKLSEAAQDTLGVEGESMKRKRRYLDTALPEVKRIKPLTRHAVLNLYETVSRRETLTGENCEFFMQGACYLSDAMLDVLKKKVIFYEVENQEIRERWLEFIKVYQKKKLEKTEQILENPLIIKDGSPVYVGGNPKEKSPMFSQLDESLMTPLFEFEDQDSSGLPFVAYDSVDDFWEQDFESVFRSVWL